MAKGKAGTRTSAHGRKNRWCPNGCGKCVSGFLFGAATDHKSYQCKRCGKKFSKEELS